MGEEVEANYLFLFDARNYGFCFLGKFTLLIITNVTTNIIKTFWKQFILKKEQSNKVYVQSC